MNSDGSNRKQILGNGIEVLSIQWRSDNKICYRAVKEDTNKDGKIDRKDKSNLWVMSPDGTNDKRIEFVGADISGVNDYNWSSDNKKVVVARGNEVQILEIE